MLAYSDEGQFMGATRRMSEATGLRQSKPELTSAVTTEIPNHSNHTGIVEITTGGISIFILVGVSRSGDRWKISTTWSLDDSIRET